MYRGYLEWSGTELVNHERTAAYLAHLAPAIMDTEVAADTLHLVRGDEPYRTPLLDAAPWSSPYDPTTDEFYGLYALSVDGIGDSTYAATTTESVENGGTTQEGRHATRDIKVSGLLVGGTELGAEAGLVWLRSALSGGECDDQCGGGYLRYFLTEPRVCPVVWGEELPDLGRASFGSLGAGQRITYRWTKNELDPSMPARVTWSGQAVEGTGLTYGARARDGSVIWSESAYPRRTNYAINPDFRVDVSGWSGSAMTWIFSGGVDDGGYATVGSVSTPASTITSGTWATPSGTVTASVALRGQTGATVTLQLLNATGSVQVASSSTVVDSDWSRLSVTGVTAGTKLRITSDDLFDVDQVLMEYGAAANPYFDGASDLDGYAVGWTGAIEQSTSTATLTSPMTFDASDSDFTPFIHVDNGSLSNVQLVWVYRRAIGVDEQLLPIDRSYHNVAVSQSVSIVQRVDATQQGGGYFIQVEVLFTAGNPFAYSPPVPVPTVPMLSSPFNDPTPTPALSDDWLFDPAALVPAAAPAAPDIVADAIDPTVTSWQRYYIDVPADTVADWASSVPLMTMNTHTSPVRQVRVRFHPNPFGYPPQQIDPTSYCADFLISYLPARTSLLMNGIVQSSTATKAGVATVPADSILYGSDGGPMTWPHLSCGIPYVLTIDVPSTSVYDLFDVELDMLREE